MSLELGTVSESVDFKDAEFQEILDVKPTKIIRKESPKQDVADKSDDKEAHAKDYLPSDIFEYFKLPAPADCDKGILGDIQEIHMRIMLEADDHDDFFFMLKAIESNVFTNDDPVKRVREVLYAIRRMGPGLKEQLKDTGMLGMDTLIEEAKDTGNWVRYLKESEKREDEVRNHNGR